MQEIVYLIQNGGDLEEAKSKSLEDRYVFLEVGFPGQKKEKDRLKDKQHPWLMKTHIPFEMMESQVTQDKVCMNIYTT